MRKKDWQDRLEGVQKLCKMAEINEKKALEDQEELNFMIAHLKDKIKTFK